MRRSLLVTAALVALCLPLSANEISLSNNHRANEMVDVNKGGIPAFGPGPAGQTQPKTVGTTSANVLAADANRSFLVLDNPSATASVACNPGGTAALNTAGSYMIPPLQTRTWRGADTPVEAINCAASAAASPLNVAAHD